MVPGGESIKPEVFTIETKVLDDFPDFNMEEMSECFPEEIPDGLPYIYFGAQALFLTGEGEGGSNGIESQPLFFPLPTINSICLPLGAS